MRCPPAPVRERRDVKVPPDRRRNGLGPYPGGMDELDDRVTAAG